jgi:Chromo (CHRromatin Organisation MOdifier) domain
MQKGKNKKTKYLVKWRGLPYEECTWEPEDALQSKEDTEKINAYNGMEFVAHLLLITHHSHH